MTNSRFEQAQQYIPGGVNSPVRAFKSVGGDPVFIKKAKGAYIWDVNDKQYIDYVGSWGPMILGHQLPAVKDAVHAAVDRGTSFGAPTVAENELAELIVDAVPSVEMVRLVNSGTEATMSAIRVARGYTGRDTIIKFSGNYHGHVDSLLVAAGSAAATDSVDSHLRQFFRHFQHHTQFTLVPSRNEVFDKEMGKWSWAFATWSRSRTRTNSPARQPATGPTRFAGFVGSQ